MFYFNQYKHIKVILIKFMFRFAYWKMRNPRYVRRIDT